MNQGGSDKLDLEALVGRPAVYITVYSTISGSTIVLMDGSTSHHEVEGLKGYPEQFSKVDLERFEARYNSLSYARN